MNDRLKGNIIEPLQLDEGEVDLFIRDRRCFCGSHLLSKIVPGPARKFKVYCYQHGYITETNHISAHEAEKVVQGEIDGKHLLKDKPDMSGKSEDDLKKELGF